MPTSTSIPEITLGRHQIGPDQPPFIIAEMSGNHNASLERALAIVDAAAAAGAQAIKLQTYTADTLTLPTESAEFRINDPASPWHGRHLHELYTEAHTPWEWHEPIFKHARARGLVCFSSPFDATAVDLLEELATPAYKIASFECVDLPLIRRVAATGKPVILSTGMATVSEIEDAVKTARAEGCRDLILLKCTSTYPASPALSNVRTIPHLREMFQCQVGLSDHTPGCGAAVAAVTLGATVIEKHLTLSRADGGIDASFSLEPEELRQLVNETERGRQSLGKIQYGAHGDEAKSLIHRRSLYITNDLQAGEELSPDNVRSVRPALGLPPKHLETVLGRAVKKAVSRGTPLTWDLLE